jgi:hypothetical protein
MHQDVATECLVARLQPHHFRKSSMLTLEVYLQVARAMVPALGAVSLGMLSSSSCLCLPRASYMSITSTHQLGNVLLMLVCKSSACAGAVDQDEMGLDIA